MKSGTGTFGGDPGRWVIEHRTIIVLFWAVAALALASEAGNAVGRFESGVRVEGSRAASVEADLATRFRSPYANSVLLVVDGVPRPDSAAGRAALETIVSTVSRAPGVSGVLSYLDDADPLFAGRQNGTFLVVGLEPSPDSPESQVSRLRQVTASLLREIRSRHPEATLGWTGEIPLNLDLRNTSSEDARAAELRAIPVALALLVLAFRSVVAALLPVGVGLLSVLLTMGASALIARQFHLSILVQNVASMIGLGLGIDYALLMVSRFREGLAAGARPRDAAQESVRRAGHTLLLSAAPVAIGFAVLLWVPTSELRSIGAAGMLVTAATLLVSCTLLPSLLSWIGSGVDRGAFPRWSHPRSPSESSVAFWRNWGLRVASHPVLAVIFGGIPIVLLGLNALRLETGALRGDWLPADPESVRALHQLEGMERANVVHSIRLVLDLPAGTSFETEDGWVALRRLTKRLQADPRIERVHSLTTVLGSSAPPGRLKRLSATSRRSLLSEDGRSALIEVLLSSRPDGGLGETERLLLLRSDAEQLAREFQTADAPGLTGLQDSVLRVAGLPAANAEFEDVIEGRFRGVLIAVVVATLLLLFAGFRSILVAVKAVVLNLVTVAGSFGALVLVFQEGHGSRLLGLAEPTGRVFTIVPILVFAIVFGLSMDYEVFLVARVAEARRAGLPEIDAIAEGVARTGRMITNAALIMVSVFAAFALGSFLPIKMLGFALAVAVALDATIVRMVIGPAILALAGRWNWWPGNLHLTSTRRPAS